MRLTLGFAAMSLFGLLAGGTLAATAIAPPQANATAPDGSVPVANTSAEADRTGQISACMASPPISLPTTTSAEAFCTCAVEVRTGNRSQRDAIFSCAAILMFNGPTFRIGEINECVSGSPGYLPEGTDANAFCTCAVDKMLANTTQRQAIDQCAAAMHLNMPAQDDAEPDMNGVEVEGNRIG